MLKTDKMPTNNPVAATTASIAKAAGILQAGGLVAFPTETVYGLGADASNTLAVQKIFAAKGRPSDHPLIVHIASLALLPNWALTIPPAALKLAEQFWPGPLAMVFNKQPTVPFAVTGGQATVAVRVPNHPVALELLTAFGGGVAAPSANRFCRISPTQAAHVAEELGSSVEMILDGGACQVGVESTIIDLSTAQPKLLRPGHISRQQLENILQTEVLAAVDATAEQINDTSVRVPGMLEIHYAPSTQALRCASAQLDTLLQTLTHQNLSTGLLSYQSRAFNDVPAKNIQLPNDPTAYAQGLYAALRQLDHCNLDVIVVEQPPTNETWRAVNDRLYKATRPS